MNQFEQKCIQIKYQYMGILQNSNYFSLKLIFWNSTYNSNSFSLYSPPLAMMTKLSSFHMNFNLMEHLGKSSLKSPKKYFFLLLGCFVWFCYVAVFQYGSLSTNILFLTRYLFLLSEPVLSFRLTTSVKVLFKFFL